MLTAGHCLPDVYQLNLEDEVYNITIKPNEYYRTYESMLKVILGAQDIQFIFEGSQPEPPVVISPISKYIRVRCHELDYVSSYKIFAIRNLIV